jgi:hypothetical protein
MKARKIRKAETLPSTPNKKGACGRLFYWVLFVVRAHKKTRRERRVFSGARN